MTKTLELIEDIGEFFRRTGRRFAIVYESTLPEAKNAEMRVAISSECDKEFLEASVEVFHRSAAVAMSQLEEKGFLEEGMGPLLDDDEDEDVPPSP